MMIFAATMEQAKVRALSGAASDFVAHVASDYSAVKPVWEQLAEAGAALPFQRGTWLAPWYAAHGRASHQPLLVTVADDGVVCLFDVAHAAAE